MNIFDTPWSRSYQLELKVAAIIRQQEINGWRIDLPKIKTLIETLENQTNDIDSQLNPKIPQFQRIPDNACVSAPFKQNGEPAFRALKWLGSPAAGPFSKVYWEPINLESDDQVKEFLLTQGWKPTEWTYDKLTGERRSPKLTEDSFASIQGGLGELVAQRMVISHRLGLLNGLLRDVRADGRIEARANTVGTNTGRMRHSVVVNIPKAKKHVFFGPEIRSCFIAAPGNLLLDVDAVGLENAMLCHYLNNKAMSELIMAGDVHTRIWNVIRDFVDSRDTSKNVYYALMYGAGDEKLGRTADKKPDGWTYAGVGREIKNRIAKELPALDKLIWAVRRASKRGYLMGLDGRRIWVRSEYSAFNALLQSAGSICMKQALVILDDWIKRDGLLCKFVGNFHDEFVLEVIPQHAEGLQGLAVLSIKEAGEQLKLNVPLAGDCHIGLDWSQVH